MFRRIVSGFKRVFQNAETKLPSTNVGVHNHQEILGKIDRFEEMSKANEIYKNAMKELSQDNTVRANLKDPKILSGLLTKDVKELTVTELEQLAEGCFDGIGVPVDKAKAFSYWEMAAEKGSFGGKFSVAQCLKEGIGAEKNPERAFQLLTEIVNSTNYAPAQYSLAMLYEKGEGTPLNLEKSYEYFKKAALGGVLPAAYGVAVALAEGRGVAKNDALAAKYFAAASEAGDPNASFTLGTWYYQGRGGLPVDKAKSFQLQSIAAEVGHPLAMFNVGTALLTGEGVEADPEKAAVWLRKAHEKGMPHATLNLTKMYMEGYGVPQDFQEAKKICSVLATKDVFAKELLEEIENEIKRSTFVVKKGEN